MSRVAALLVVAACAEPDPPIGEPWTVTTMPERRLEAAAGALGTRLVLVGGFEASMVEGLPITTKVLTYDTQATELGIDPWNELPPLPVQWTHANVAAVGGIVYVLGGLEGRTFQASNRVFVLEAGAEDWTELVDEPLPQARGAAAVVVSKGHIFLLGGASTTEALATNLDFDITTRAWSTPPPDLRVPRTHAAAMRRYDGAFVIVGGLGDLTSAQPLGDVDVLPQDATTWLLVEPNGIGMTPRGGCAYGVVFGNLICAGGEAGLIALDVVEIYNPITNAWTSGESMPEPRAGAGGVVVANQLYVSGGAATLAFEPTATLYAFAPFAPRP